MHLHRRLGNISKAISLYGLARSPSHRVSTIIPDLMPTLWRSKLVDGVSSILATCVLMVERATCLN